MKTVLVADDEANVRHLVRVTLEGPDLVVLEAENGRQALQQCMSHTVDLVILDWSMPGVGGLEVARELGRRAAVIPVLMLTARHQQVDVMLARDAGVLGYLTKPFSPLELIANVEELLRTAPGQDPLPLPPARR